MWPLNKMLHIQKKSGGTWVPKLAPTVMEQTIKCFVCWHYQQMEEQMQETEAYLRWFPQYFLNRLLMPTLQMDGTISFIILSREEYRPITFL